MRTFWTIVILFFCIQGADAQVGVSTQENSATDLHVVIKGGNIFVETAGQSRQLTQSGMDSDAIVSPDKRSLVYTHRKGKWSDDPTECQGGANADELKQIGVDGKNDRVLIQGHPGATPQQQVCDFGQKQFTSDGQKLFFISRAWATSGALHVYDFHKLAEKYVAPANIVVVLNFCGGEHVDQLVLGQHRYFIGGGSYNWFWLFDKSGSKQLGPFSDEGGTLQSIVQKAKMMLCSR